MGVGPAPPPFPSRAELCFPPPLLVADGAWSEGKEKSRDNLWLQRCENAAGEGRGAKFSLPLLSLPSVQKKRPWTTTTENTFLRRRRRKISAFARPVVRERKGEREKWHFAPLRRGVAIEKRQAAADPITAQGLCLSFPLFLPRIYQPFAIFSPPSFPKRKSNGRRV